MQVTIDVVIPTYRVNEKYLLPVLNLDIPLQADVKFYLIADNPVAAIPASIRTIAEKKNIQVMINDRNMGAAMTRNAGINAGLGDWILLLDDDIDPDPQLLHVYTKAAIEHSDATGFIGLVTLPAPVNTFTNAIQVSGSMDVFGVALHKKEAAWGATANIMFSRKTMGDVRFSGEFPKAGGGEDIDFFLKVRENNNYRNLLTLPAAVVHHPWWNDGRVNFARSYRYGIGNSILVKLNPAYTYRDFFNTAEVLFLLIIAAGLLLFIAPAWIAKLSVFAAGAIIIEWLANAVQSVKYTSSFNPGIIYYTTVMRFVFDTGELIKNIRSWRFHAIGLRFHYDGKIKKIDFYRTNTRKLIKLILYPLLFWLVI